MSYWSRVHYDDHKYGPPKKSKYDATVGDPTDLFVPAPERGGIKIGGCYVDKEVIEVMDQVVDRGLFRCRTKADIVRTAVTHFVMDQIQPALDVHPHRFRAYKELLQLQSQVYREDQHAKMLREAEAVYSSKPQCRDMALEHLRRYAQALIEDHLVDEAKNWFKASKVLGAEFAAYLSRPIEPDPEDVEFQRQLDMDQAGVDSMDSDDALEALAREESEEEERG